ncbi:MAG: putative glycoside hydrolase [Planctomycetota bacterium]
MTRRCLGIVLGCVAVVALLGCRRNDATDPATVPPLPIHIYAEMLRGDPVDDYGYIHLLWMSTYFNAIIGLDNHGATFPGAIEAFRRIDSKKTVLSITGINTLHPADPRFASCDRVERVFLHSADPASLRVVSHAGKTIGWFRQDVRTRVIDQHYDPPGVLEYLVEQASSANGPWSQVGKSIPEDGTPLRRFDIAGVDTSRYYRVRTRLADGDLVSYSWPATIDSGDDLALAYAFLDTDGSMVARCYGSDCPTDPARLVCELDLDRDRIFGEESAEHGASERWPFETVSAEGDGAMVYEGQAGFTTNRLFAYRVVNDERPEVQIPSRGSYQWAGHNNRIQMPQFKSFILDPGHGFWHDMLLGRMADALQAGYSGLRLDFVFDTIEDSWIATSMPHDWAGPGDMSLRDGILDLLQALRASAPSAVIAINGYFVVDDPENFWRYMEFADIGEIEFFAYGFSPDSSVPSESTDEALTAVIEARERGEQCVAVAGGAVEDHRARLGALALYLLVAGPTSSFWYQTDRELFALFPEWQVSLGRPLGPVNTLEDLLDPNYPGLLSRTFESGVVYFNSNTEPLVLSLDEALHLLQVSGGTSTEVGGNGQALYTRVNEVTIAPMESAILVRDPP